MPVRCWLINSWTRCSRVVVEIVYGLRAAGPAATVTGIDNIGDFSAGTGAGIVDFTGICAGDEGCSGVKLVTGTGEVIPAGEPTGVSGWGCPTGTEPGHGIIPLNRKTRASIPAPRMTIMKK